ncbi:YpoC family protein [Macrococcus animalis]|uniref:YpoC family protein n=1 Tax=Macrococcus animalis TaxID=3395467 RepID=UPI0039BFDB0F
MMERMNELEVLIDTHSSSRTLNSDDAISLLDEYFDGLLYLMHELNDLAPSSNITDFEIEPLNFKERIQYIKARKHHFMGYQQMKTIRIEINKLIAIQNIKKKRQH